MVSVINIGEKDVIWGWKDRFDLLGEFGFVLSIKGRS